MRLVASTAGSIVQRHFFDLSADMFVSTQEIAEQTRSYQAMRRPYKRVTRYPTNLNIPMSNDMRTALEEIADRSDIPVVEAARRVISRGLKVVGDAAVEEQPQSPPAASAPAGTVPPGGVALTPLHWAALAGNAPAVESLIALGADLKAKDGGWAPLHAAALGGNPAVINEIAKGGADVDARDETSSSPLHWAALAGNSSAVEALIEAGADATARDREGLLPYDRAHERLRNTPAYKQLELARWNSG